VEGEEKKKGDGGVSPWGEPPPDATLLDTERDGTGVASEGDAA
jgi:hypothetical protein